MEKKYFDFIGCTMVACTIWIFRSLLGCFSFLKIQFYFFHIIQSKEFERFKFVASWFWLSTKSKINFARLIKFQSKWFLSSPLLSPFLFTWRTKVRNTSYVTQEGKKKVWSLQEKGKVWAVGLKSKGLVLFSVFLFFFFI